MNKGLKPSPVFLHLSHTSRKRNTDLMNKGLKLKLSSRLLVFFTRSAEKKH